MTDPTRLIGHDRSGMTGQAQAGTAGGWGAPPGPPDPKRWIALVILSSTLFIIVLDNTILNVAVPTIIREFHTQVSSMQWVISGYSLVFASLLISFGRLGDIVGRRRMFFIGASLFAVGSLIASLSQSVVQLFIGESLIEGIGAAMMLPATLSILSATFRGRERGVAFAVWGSVAGGAGALGPWIGGILTTELLVALGVPRQRRDRAARRSSPASSTCTSRRTSAPRASTRPVSPRSRSGCSRSCSASSKPGATDGGGRSVTSRSAVGNGRCTRCRSCRCRWRSRVVALGVFVWLELRRVAAGKPVVFDFTDLVHRGFRYGLINTTVLAMGEFGAFFVLPIFLQAGLHLSAVQSGTWLLPAGIMAFVGGGIGGQLSRRFGPKYVITVGLTLEALGIWLYVAAFSTSTTFCVAASRR